MKNFLDEFFTVCTSTRMEVHDWVKKIAQSCDIVMISRDVRITMMKLMAMSTQIFHFSQFSSHSQRTFFDGVSSSLRVSLQQALSFLSTTL